MAKNTGKVREKSGNFVSPEKWEPCVHPLHMEPHWTRNLLQAMPPLTLNLQEVVAKETWTHA